MTALDATMLAEKLPAALAPMLGMGKVAVIGARKLSGGAIQENWWLDLEADGVRRSVVLRADAPSRVAVSRSRSEEAMILEAVHAAGVRAPEPIGTCNDRSVIGRSFSVIGAVRGEALGRRVVRDPRFAEARRELPRQLGSELAKLHAISPAEALLAVLGPKLADPIAAMIEDYRAALDRVSRPALVVELALRWLETHRPHACQVALCHRDFRTGNFMIDEHGLVAILDWEFAGWSDPVEDIGWICAKPWRFGADDRRAGGIGDLGSLLDGYKSSSGWRPDPARVDFWEIAANIRWAVIAHEQADRLLVAGERSLDLALIGRRIHETEHELLRLMTQQGEAAA